MPLRLSSRLHAAPADPVVVARIAALSGARVSGDGWTPKTLPDGRHAAPSATPDLLAEPPQTKRRLPPRPTPIKHHILEALEVHPRPTDDLWQRAAAQHRPVEARLPASSPHQPIATPARPSTMPGAAPPESPAEASSARVPEPDVAAALREEPPLDLGLDAGRSALERWKAGRTDPGRRGVVALALLAVLAVVLTAFVVLHGRPEAVTAPEITAAGVPVGETPAPEATGDIVVSVGGKVARPGVVTLPAGARVNDALTAAGGPTEPDAVGLLNLARRLVDGEQVLVGVEPPPGAETGPAGVPGDSRVDLNAADVAGFDSLSGIGPVLAERIVAWREQHGRFTSVDQLREVSGIGEAKFASVKDAVRV